MKRLTRKLIEARKQAFKTEFDLYMRRMILRHEVNVVKEQLENLAYEKEITETDYGTRSASFYSERIVQLQERLYDLEWKLDEVERKYRKADEIAKTLTRLLQ